MTISSWIFCSCDKICLSMKGRKHWCQDSLTKKCLLKLIILKCFIFNHYVLTNCLTVWAGNETSGFRSTVWLHTWHITISLSNEVLPLNRRELSVSINIFDFNGVGLVMECLTGRDLKTIKSKPLACCRTHS